MKKTGRIRIIGGRWKSRLLRCDGAAGLRPSPDAVRETLFNWLSLQLPGKSCLDLFAGSGAFGFEAASRGAARVVLVESNANAIELLRANREALGAEEKVEIFAGTVEGFFQRRSGDKGEGGFDIVFMDPPFAGQMIEATCRNIQSRGLLRPRALVYIESPRGECPLPIPSGWHIIRQSRCGKVQSTLVQT